MSLTLDNVFIPPCPGMKSDSENQLLFHAVMKYKAYLYMQKSSYKMNVIPKEVPPNPPAPTSLPPLVFVALFFPPPPPPPPLYRSSHLKSDGATLTICLFSGPCCWHCTVLGERESLWNGAS